MKKVSHDDGYFVMKVILWWNLSRDESNLVMKVMIVKELMTGDVSPVAMFFWGGGGKIDLSCIPETWLTGPPSKCPKDKTLNNAINFTNYFSCDSWAIINCFREAFAAIKHRCVLFVLLGEKNRGICDWFCWKSFLAQYESIFSAGIGKNNKIYLPATHFSCRPVKYRHRRNVTCHHFFDYHDFHH